MTFISNNPLIVFVGKDVGVVKPNVVRVQYTLKPEADTKKSYALFRQESTELDLAQYKNVRPYEVIGGIRSCAITFTARTEKKQEQSKGVEVQAAQEQQKKLYEYKTSDTWVSEQKKEADKEQTVPRIPFMVEFKMILWDKQNKREQEFTFVCEIPTDMTPAKKEQSVRQQEKTQAKKPQEQGNAGGDGGTTQGDVIAQDTFKKVTTAFENINQMLSQR